MIHNECPYVLPYVRNPIIFRTVTDTKKCDNKKLRIDKNGCNEKLFFQNFLCCCTSTHRDETFLLLPKFHIFSRSEKSGGDKKKALHQRRRTTTNERTTLTIIIPRQDSQNPRANNCSLLFNFTYNLLCRR